jgi:hypothetical protein
VHELSFAVDQIAVSEMLPRTPELIFVNLTSVEGGCALSRASLCVAGQPYCLELSFRGWRVCSCRHDCMMGDWQRLSLHSRYFETVYAVMGEISDGYRQRFGEKVCAQMR